MWGWLSGFIKVTSLPEFLQQERILKTDEGEYLIESFKLEQGLIRLKLKEEAGWRYFEFHNPQFDPSTQKFYLQTSETTYIQIR
jgi:hypothetical protein